MPGKGNAAAHRVGLSGTEGLSEEELQEMLDDEEADAEE
jgi:hypothetical protein